METNDVVLSLHGETTDPHVDVFDREERFINEDWWFARLNFPNLKMVFEHITTREALAAIRTIQPLNGQTLTAATITPQHLLASRNDMLGNGIRPHYYCKPILKREEDRQALLEAATSGESCFFLGTDSAPHSKEDKENSCGCAGCFTGLHALELYAEAFDSVGKIEMLPDFAGAFGAQFYGLPHPTRTIRMKREEWEVPQLIFQDASEVVDILPDWPCIVPFYAGEKLQWKMVD